MLRPARPIAAALALVAALPALATEPTVPAQAAAPATSPDSSAKAAKARAYFTDTVLLDQDGQPRRFYGDVLEGKVVCLSFVFTNCGQACPLIMQKLKRAREKLGARGQEVEFVSISVDPENDTPKALKAFAAKFGATGPGWTFLTGSRQDLKAVLGKLGTWTEDPGDHQTGFVAGNVRTHHWTKIRPDVVADGVAELLRGLVEEDRPGPVQGAVAARPAAP